MSRKIVIALLALPLGVIPLATKPATAATASFPSNVNQKTIVVAQRYDDWRDRNRNDDRQEVIRREEARREALRRQDNRRERRVWIPGHWESGFLGIGRKWVEGHWETR